MKVYIYKYMYLYNILNLSKNTKMSLVRIQLNPLYKGAKLITNFYRYK